jgi:hypothetical protein
MTDAPPRRRRAQKAAPVPAVAADREVTPSDLEASIGADAKHAKRLAVAHRCAERFAGRALPSKLAHGYAQGVQRLAEWLAFTGRDLDGDIPAPEEIPAVVRYHWMTAEA